jgi:hypothetical protein
VTLADEILSQDDDLQLVTLGLPLGFVKDGIRQAQRFCFEPEAVEAVINLLHSKPSSLTEAAFQFARLPYSKCWIEWPTPSIQPLLPNQIATSRTGVLLVNSGKTGFMVLTAWSYSNKTWRQRRVNDGVTELSKVGWSEMCGLVDFDFPPVDSMRIWERHPDPKEDAAAAKLERSIGFRVIGPKTGADLEGDTPAAALRQYFGYDDLRTIYGVELAESKLTDVAQEIKPVIGMLILLNSKNCVSTAFTEPAPALNKARVKRGRLPLVSYTNVSISLSRRDSRQASAHGVSAEDIRQHLVRGHFKIRKTGVYWWRNHIRGAAAAGTVEHKSYRVSA